MNAHIREKANWDEVKKFKNENFKAIGDHDFIGILSGTEEVDPGLTPDEREQIDILRAQILAKVTGKAISVQQFTYFPNVDVPMLSIRTYSIHPNTKAEIVILIGKKQEKSTQWIFEDVEETKTETKTYKNIKIHNDGTTEISEPVHKEKKSTLSYTQAHEVPLESKTVEYFPPLLAVKTSKAP